jgi:hypothetical protein
MFAEISDCRSTGWLLRRVSLRVTGCYCRCVPEEGPILVFGALHCALLQGGTLA